MREIAVEQGRATGVVHDDGIVIAGRKFVASAIDFLSSLDMAGPEHFPSRCAKSQGLALGQTVSARCI